MKKTILLISCLIFPLILIAAKKDTRDPSKELRDKYLNSITNVLNSDNPSLKIEAIKILGTILDKSTVPYLKKLLTDQNDSVKIEAGLVLNKLKDNSGVEIIANILKTPVSFPPNPKPIERARAIARGTVRARAAEILGEINATNYENLLRQMTKDQDGRVADASLIALVKLGDRSGIKTFVNALNSSDHYVRLQACIALGIMKEKSAISDLKRLLTYWDKDVRAQACLALGKIGDQSAGHLIKELLYDKSETVRSNACLALGLIKDPKLVPDLESRLQDENGLVRLTAIEALLLFDSSTIDKNENILFNALESPDTDAQIKAIQIIGEYAQPEIITKLENLFNRSENEIVKLSVAGAIIRILDRNSLK